MHTQPGTGNCAPEQDERWELEQVLPTSEGLAGFTVPQGGRWYPPENVDAMHGVWFAARGGHLLELAPEGTYALAGETGDVLDRGRWSLGSGRASLHLDSGADSPTCEVGHRFVLAAIGLSYVYPDNPGLRGTVTRNDCHGAWGKNTWMHLSG